MIRNRVTRSRQTGVEIINNTRALLSEVDGWDPNGTYCCR